MLIPETPMQYPFAAKKRSSSTALARLAFTLGLAALAALAALAGAAQRL